MDDVEPARLGGAARTRRRQLTALRLAYLLDHSPFYRREARRTVGHRRRPRRDREPAADREGRGEGDVHGREPDRSASLRPMSEEIVRIYSTSGTTGRAELHPAHAADLDNWVTGSARSYAASGIAAGRPRGHDLQRRTVRRRRRARRVRADRRLSHPGRHRQQRAPAAARSSSCGPTPSCSRRPTPSTCSSWPTCAIVERPPRILVAGEPGGGEPAFRAKLEDGWGARVTEAMGIGDIGPSLWGECEEQDGDAPRRARLRPCGADRSRDRRRPRARRRRDGRTGLTHLRHEAAPLLRFRTRDHVEMWTEPLPVRAHGAARALHRPHRRHADRARRQRLSVGSARGRQRVRAGGQRAHARSAGGGRREAGAAAARCGRAGRASRAGSGLAAAIRGAAARRTRRPDRGRARPWGTLATKRVQVQTRETR